MKNVLLKCGILLAGVALLGGMMAAGIPCLFQSVFHVICPGCGMTRAILACLHLDFVQAFRWHPMVFFLPLMFLYFWKDGKVWNNPWLNNSVLALLVVGTFANYIYRLIECY